MKLYWLLQVKGAVFDGTGSKQTKIMKSMKRPLFYHVFLKALEVSSSEESVFAFKSEQLLCSTMQKDVEINIVHKSKKYFTSNSRLLGTAQQYAIYFPSNQDT